MESFYSEEKSLMENYEELYKHLKEESWVSMYSNNEISINIPEEGDCSHWYKGLVELILRKIKNQDKELIEFCIKNKIDLVESSFKPIVEPKTS